MKKHDTQKDLPVMLLAGGMAFLGAVVCMISQPIYRTVVRRNLPFSETPIYYAGVYEGTARGYAGDVTVTAVLSEYGMEEIRVKAEQETPEIGQAAAATLANEIWKHQSHSVDAVSGATMTSNAVKQAMAHCIREAVREDTELAEIIKREKEQEHSQAELPELSALLQGAEDGIYLWVDTESDENGFFNQIDVTVQEHQITALTWDAVNEEGAGKRQLSADGNYTMTEHGALWYEQADALSAYVIEHQSTEDLMNEAGTCDAIASVSIHIGGFVDSVKKSLLEGSLR